MIRGRLLIAAALAGGALAVVPALAADQTVTANQDNTFTPATVSVSVGDTVTFVNGGGYHNLRFRDRSSPENQPSALPWTIKRKFDKPGKIAFVCDVHETAGMEGVVVVAGPDGSTGTTTGTSTTPPPAGGAELISARAVRDRFCTKKSASCKKPGIVLRVKTSGKLKVTGKLERRALRSPRSGRYSSFGKVAFTAPSGTSTVSLLRRSDGRRIGRGDYRMTLASSGGKLTLKFYVR